MAENDNSQTILIPSIKEEKIIKNQELAIAELQKELNTIKNSLTWRLVMKSDRIIKFILGSKGSNLYYNFLKIIKHKIPTQKEKDILILFSKIIKHYFTEELSEVNNHSRKLAKKLIGHYSQINGGLDLLHNNLRAIYPEKIQGVKKPDTKINGNKKLKILFISGMFPSTNHGGGLRLFDIISKLSEKHEVDLYTRYIPEMDSKYLDLIESKVVNIKTMDLLKFEGLEEWLKSINKNNKYYDVIQVEFMSSLFPLDKLYPYGEKIGLTFMECTTKRSAIDIDKKIKEKKETLGSVLDFIENAKIENYASHNVDFTLGVTTRDRDFISKFNGLIPNVILTGISSLLTDQNQTRDQIPEYDATFVGYFGHYPNFDAMEWYLKKIHPLIKESLPNYKMQIIGYGDTSKLKSLVADDQSVTFTGFVDDLSAHISKTKICISPLISGAGLRGKIIQYSALGKPTVSTSIGISGTPYENGESVLRADTAEDFAISIIRLLTDATLFNKIKRNCQTIVDKYFNWEPQINKLESIYLGENVFPLKASIIVTTKDRGPIISETVSSLINQDFPQDKYEIILVDNLSNEENQKYLKNLVSDYPVKVKYIREEKAGLSHARNCGIHESEGEIIIFIDEDAIAPMCWVKNIIEAFDNNPKTFVLGGKVIAQFKTPPPSWIDKRLGVYISNFDHGDQIMELHYNEYPRGVNMAFRRGVFGECGYFLDCFSRKGRLLMSYEEIELIYRVEKNNHSILYLPNAEVYHLIRGDRLNKNWFNRRFYWQGRSEGLFEIIHYGKIRTAKTLSKHFKNFLVGEDVYSKLYHLGFIVSVLLNSFKKRFD